MSQIVQEGLADLNLEEIDDFNWFVNALEEVQDNSLNNIRVPVDNNYNSQYNVTFRRGEMQPFTFPENYQNSSTAVLPNSYSESDANSFGPESPMDSYSSEFASGTDSLSSDFASNMVLVPSNASSAVSLPVKQLLNGMIKKKMRAEGRPETPLTSSPKDSVVDQLTPEEEQKKLEKQQRNKESARRSRQKKKEEEEKLLTDNKRLTSENEELKNQVAILKLGNFKYEEFFSTHPCVMSPQQDNGDKICVETGRSKVYDDDAESGDTEEKVLETAFELRSEYCVPIPYNQGSPSQQKLAILCQLGDDDPFEMVTSVTAYEPKRGNYAIGVSNIGIQENIAPDISCNVVNQGELSMTTNGGFGIGVQENVFPDISNNVISQMKLSMTPSGGFGIGVQENVFPDISKNVVNQEKLNVTANGGFGIGVQENVFPDMSYVTSHEEFKTLDGATSGKLLAGSKEVGPGKQICNAESFGAYGQNTQVYNANSVSTYQLMSHGMSAMTGEVAQTNNPSVPMMKQSETNINPWCTDDGNQSEAEEALKLVQDLSPPPVKKFRFE